MSEEQLEQHLEDKKSAPLSQTIGFGAGTFLTLGTIDLLAHLGPTGLVVGGIVAFVAAQHGPELANQVKEAFPSLPPSRQPGIEQPRRSMGRSLIDRALGRFPAEDRAPAEDDEEYLVADPEEIEQSAESSALDDEGAAFAQKALQKGVPGVARLTLDQIVRHIEPNSYKIYIGRSLTRPGNPAIPISFYKRHIKIIGASQYGKSSMAAALLEIITRTHDPRHVLVALLDREDQTSKLFATIAHRAQVFVDGRPVVLHARTPEQVLAYLGYLIQVMEYRYTLSKTEMLQEPLILVYLEEFIALKDYFKSRIDAVWKEEKEQAKRDYVDLVFRIKELARRGLKAGMQLLMCAQCDYRDDDLQEALINVTAGMSFCVRVTAAQAAGFYQTELLARNAKEDNKGQAVVEMPDCKDLVLVPEYDLEQRLITLEKAELAEAKRQGKSADEACARPWQRMTSSQPASGTPSTPVYASQAEQVTHLPMQPPRALRLAETAARHLGTLPGDLRAALDVYRPGMSYRDLGKALRCDDGEARMVWQELRRRGLLHVYEEQEPAERAIPPKPQKPVSEESELERALHAYDQGNTTLDALAVALGKTSWTVRPLYAQVKRLREHAS